jgi:hypothetical protein
MLRFKIKFTLLELKAMWFAIYDALLGPGVNPVEGSPNVKLWKLGSKGTLPAPNSRKG